MDQQEKFREAITGNERRIYSICCYYFGSGDEARDAYQEILIKIWLNISKFRGESQLKTWVTSIAVNVCLTFLSKAKRNNSLFTPFSKMEYFDKGSDYEPEENMEEEKLKFFREFSSRLSPVDRTLVSLYLGDVDYREISQVTGLSEVNARSRIHRIKGQIKKEWEEKNGTR